MAIPYWMSRTQLMLGDEKVYNLIDKHVLVVGLGGVGGICAEMIARSGVGKMTIVDNDIVDPSNANRQVAALSSTFGMLKAEVMAKRLKDINPELDLTVQPIYLINDKIPELLQQTKYDYAVDCIDTLGPKTHFIKNCLEQNIPIVTSLGAGGKVDPSQIQVADISKTFNCTLAKHVRKRLRYMGITKGLKVVFSPEEIDETKVIVTEKAYPKKSVIGTISYMPAIFGCTVASVVIRDLIDN